MSNEEQCVAIEFDMNKEVEEAKQELGVERFQKFMDLRATKLIISTIPASSAGPEALRTLLLDAFEHGLSAGEDAVHRAMEKGIKQAIRSKGLESAIERALERAKSAKRES